MLTVAKILGITREKTERNNQKVQLMECIKDSTDKVRLHSQDKTLQFNEVERFSFMIKL